MQELAANHPTLHPLGIRGRIVLSFVMHHPLFCSILRASVLCCVLLGQRHNVLLVAIVVRGCVFWLFAFVFLPSPIIANVANFFNIKQTQRRNTTLSCPCDPPTYIVYGFDRFPPSPPFLSLNASSVSSFFLHCMDIVFLPFCWSGTTTVSD